MGPSVRLALAIAAMLAVAVAGLGAVGLGLVPHRVPTPTITAPDRPHDFPDLEAILPLNIAGRAAELRGSFDGTVPADDESQYGGLYTALGAELDYDLGRVQMAEEYIPGRTEADWAAVSVYRLPGRSASGWQGTLDSLLAGTVSDQVWTFRRDVVAGRNVLVGSYEGSDEDWICAVGDLLVEIQVEDPSAAEAILSALP